MPDPRKVNFNPIYDREQPTLAEDLEWNFDQIRELADDVVSALAIADVVGHYEETFTATTTYNVAHDLGSSHPQVSVYNSAGTRINVLVTTVTSDLIRLTFTGTLTNAVVAVDVAQT